MTGPLFEPGSRAETIYHFGVIILLGIAAITGAANLYATLTEPEPPATAWCQPIVGDPADVYPCPIEP